MNSRNFPLSLIVTSALLGGSATAQQPASALHWYKCNTHTHTSAFPGSDANGSPEFVAEWYRTHGYQCVVITDHEHLTDVSSLNQKYGSEFLVIKGQEVTDSVRAPNRRDGVRHTHMNGIGLEKLDKPIIPAGKAQGTSATESYQRSLAAIDAAGGIPQVNHPAIQLAISDKDLLPLTKPFLMEVWNAFPTINNLGGTDGDGNVGMSPESIWDSLLSHGKVVWGVASDDTHEYRAFDDREAPTPGKAWIVVRAPNLTLASITDAIRKGQFYASSGVTIGTYSVDDNEISMRFAEQKTWSPSLQSSTRYLTRFIGENGKVLGEVLGTMPRYRFKGSEQYIRASIIDSDGRRAWTQPVFRDARKSASK